MLLKIVPRWTLGSGTRRVKLLAIFHHKKSQNNKWLVHLAVNTVCGNSGLSVPLEEEPCNLPCVHGETSREMHVWNPSDVLRLCVKCMSESTLFRVTFMLWYNENKSWKGLQNFIGNVSHIVDFPPYFKNRHLPHSEASTMKRKNFLLKNKFLPFRLSSFCQETQKFWQDLLPLQVYQFSLHGDIC